MKGNNKKIKITFKLGENVFLRDKDVIDKASKYLNFKRFKVSDTPFTYRQINSLDANKLLLDNRKNKMDWRRFSFKEIFYLSIIKELRRYGFNDGQFLSLKKAFFSKEHEYFSDLALLMAWLRDIKIIMTIDAEMNLSFYLFIAFNNFERKTSSLIYVNLNEVINSVCNKLNIKTNEYIDDTKLNSALLHNSDTNDKEKKILEIIRNKDYRTISISKNSDTEFLVKGEKVKMIREKELIEMIREKDFAQFDIVKRDGKIVKISIGENFKI